MNTFTTELTVRVTDINYGGHLGTDRVLALFHEARVRFLKALELSEKDIGDGVSLTQTEALVQYKGEAFLGDSLTCVVWIDQFGGIRFRMCYELLQAVTGKLIASGYTDLAGFDYRTHKLKRLPLSFKEKAGRFIKEVPALRIES